MPARDQTSRQIRHELSDRGLSPGDRLHDFALRAAEDLNQATADLDDELADIAERLAWLSRVPIWVNQRPPEEFQVFVPTKLTECEKALAAVRQRWERHQQERPPDPP